MVFGLEGKKAQFPAQYLGHFRRGQRGEAQPRTPGTHRRQQRIRNRRDQHEHRRRRRLLERLQQRILRCRHQCVCLVDDHHASSSFEGTVIGAVDDIADLLDLDRTHIARLDHDDVGVHTALDAAAGRALAARVSGELGSAGHFSPAEAGHYIQLRLEAVHRFGNRHSGATLADARGSGQQQRRRQRVTGDRAG